MDTGRAARTERECGAKHTNRTGFVTCRKNKNHILHHSKYQRQHSDPKSYPVAYWEPTPEELKAAEFNLTSKE